MLDCCVHCCQLYASNCFTAVCTAAATSVLKCCVYYYLCWAHSDCCSPGLRCFFLYKLSLCIELSMLVAHTPVCQRPTGVSLMQHWAVPGIGYSDGGLRAAQYSSTLPVFFIHSSVHLVRRWTETFFVCSRVWCFCCVFSISHCFLSAPLTAAPSSLL